MPSIRAVVRSHGAVLRDDFNDQSWCGSELVGPACPPRFPASGTSSRPCADRAGRHGCRRHRCRPGSPRDAAHANAPTARGRRIGVLTLAADLPRCDTRGSADGGPGRRRRRRSSHFGRVRRTQVYEAGPTQPATRSRPTTGEHHPDRYESAGERTATPPSRIRSHIPTLRRGAGRQSSKAQCLRRLDTVSTTPGQGPPRFESIVISLYARPAKDPEQPLRGKSVGPLPRHRRCATSYRSRSANSHSSDVGLRHSTSAGQYGYRDDALMKKIDIGRSSCDRGYRTRTPGRLVVADGEPPGFRRSTDVLFDVNTDRVERATARARGRSV